MFPVSFHLVWTARNTPPPPIFVYYCFCAMRCVFTWDSWDFGFFISFCLWLVVWMCLSARSLWYYHITTVLVAFAVSNRTKNLTQHNLIVLCFCFRKLYTSQASPIKFSSLCVCVCVRVLKIIVIQTVFFFSFLIKARYLSVGNKK